MKKTLLVFMLFSTAFFANKVYAQFSLGAELALPVGDFSDLSSLGFGATAGYDYPVTEKFKIGANAGYIFMLVKDEYKDGLGAIFGDNVDVNIGMIPIQAHAKYHLTEQFYLMGLAGIHMINVKVEALGESETESDTEFSFGFGAGVNLGVVDIGARYQIINGSDYIGARVAYLFGGK